MHLTTNNSQTDHVLGLNSPTGVTITAGYALPNEKNPLLDFKSNCFERAN